MLSMISQSISFSTKLNVLFTTIVFSVLSYADVGYADAVDNATAADITDLCNDSPANELFKIATKSSNSQELRRSALARMVEVARECSDASDQRLSQYHKKLISAAHSIVELSEVESRRIAVEGFQYVIMQPDNVQPPPGSIDRGQTIANLALTDSNVNIRLWALEALVTLRGEDALVQSTLTSATSDPEVIVQQTATDMLAELFDP